MAKALECIQGDSFSYDIDSPNVDLFDINWTGTWAIVDAIPPTSTEATRGLSISSDQTKLEMRILPTDTDSIIVGNYYLIVQITNASIGFNQEIIQKQFNIVPQGI